MAQVDIDSIEITDELMEKVALAQLYRDDPLTEIRKALDIKLDTKSLEALYKRILSHDRFNIVKEDAIKLESSTLIEENTDTLLLYLNKLLKQAQFEKKYEVVTRIIQQIKQLKAVQNEEQRFEIIIKIEDPNNKTDTKP